MNTLILQEIWKLNKLRYMELEKMTIIAEDLGAIVKK